MEDTLHLNVTPTPGTWVREVFERIDAVLPVKLSFLTVELGRAVPADQLEPEPLAAGQSTASSATSLVETSPGLYRHAAAAGSLADNPLLNEYLALRGLMNEEELREAAELYPGDE